MSDAINIPGVQEPVSSPLAGFEQSYIQVMQGAAPQGLRHDSQAAAWAKGAAVGFASALVWHQMKKRKAAKG